MKLCGKIVAEFATIKTEEGYMFGKHIKAACLAIALGLIAVMFFMVTILNGEIIDSASPIGAIVLLIIAVAAIIPVFAAHERHN